jgi:hypothetical protein
MIQVFVATLRKVAVFPRASVRVAGFAPKVPTPSPLKMLTAASLPMVTTVATAEPPFVLSRRIVAPMGNAVVAFAGTFHCLGRVVALVDHFSVVRQDQRAVVPPVRVFIGVHESLPCARLSNLRLPCQRRRPSCS